MLFKWYLPIPLHYYFFECLLLVYPENNSDDLFPSNKNMLISEHKLIYDRLVELFSLFYKQAKRLVLISRKLHLTTW